jgi:hypothetical protein
MKIPTYDIFSGHFPGGDALWIEKVEGLGDAVSRMKQLAASDPGDYFVFSIEKHEVVASIDTAKSGTENQVEHSDQTG